MEIFKLLFKFLLFSSWELAAELIKDFPIELSCLIIYFIALLISQLHTKMILTIAFWIIKIFCSDFVYYQWLKIKSTGESKIKLIMRFFVLFHVAFVRFSFFSFLEHFGNCTVLYRCLWSSIFWDFFGLSGFFLDWRLFRLLRFRFN